MARSLAAFVNFTGKVEARAGIEPACKDLQSSSKEAKSISI